MLRTGAEEKFKSDAERKLVELSIPSNFYFFKKVLKTSKGEFYQTPLFPGYVFLEIENLSFELINIFKTIDGFYHFLFENSNVQRLTGKDLEYFNNFKQFGDVLNPSKAYFDKNQRIVIVEGPLSGLSGNIIRVNRRQKRVTVCIGLYGSAKTVDLMYEEVAPA